MTSRANHARYLNWCVYLNAVQLEAKLLGLAFCVWLGIYHTFFRQWDLFTPLAWWSMICCSHWLWGEITMHYDALRHYLKNYHLFLNQIPT